MTYREAVEIMDQFEHEIRKAIEEKRGIVINPEQVKELWEAFTTSAY